MGTICTDNGAACSIAIGTIQPRGLVSRLKQLGRYMIVWILGREEKRLSRIALSELTDDQLADIGVTPAEARREAARPFWD
ncbi:DUF1127 domain-containing protein [Rhizobium sp. LjRoot98]|uniref:DUF1127 domain-containing protein n=1 Tax=unclassified Rhizobium TaxID=2613769 RepID=UPI001FCCD2BA|nr:MULTISPECIES: DUF1127 domain-containing protein [unclassified Rhizobium]